MLDLSGKVALVTGGSRGIGRAIALRLAGAGASVAICGRTQESLDSALAQIRDTGGQAWAFRTDVSDHDQIMRLVTECIDAAGGIDMLINNAVGSVSGRFDQLGDDAFRHHIDVKLMAYIRLCRLVLPEMRARGGGRIVNIGGMTARITAPLRMTNGVVNAGVANFTKQFAGFAAEAGVTVNCVHPGYTATERVREIFEREVAETGDPLETVVARRTAEIPLGRLIEPDDLARAVLFLCSPMASMITGQCIAVDGGSGTAVTY